MSRILQYLLVMELMRTGRIVYEIVASEQQCASGYPPGSAHPPADRPSFAHDADDRRRKSEHRIAGSDKSSPAGPSASSESDSDGENDGSSSLSARSQADGRADEEPEDESGEGEGGKEREDPPGVGEAFYAPGEEVLDRRGDAAMGAELRINVIPYHSSLLGKRTVLLGERQQSLR